MPINPSIALGVKPMELPDPLAAYSKFAAIQQGQTQNQLYQMQMEKLRREQTALNMLNEAYGKSVDPTTGAVDQNMLAQNLAQMGQGAQIPGTLESFAKLAEQQAKRQKAELDVATTRMSQARDALTVVTTPGQYAQWRVNTISQLPGLANMIPLDYTPDTVRRLMAGAEKWLAETAPAKPTQPLAPSITEIQDPTNPNQMIRIDARVYQGGGIGSPGVIGTSGKAPAVATAEQKRVEGTAQAKDILDTLRASYDELDRLRAIPSEQRNVLSNTLSYIAATGVGQVAGRIGGTKEQTQRDIIGSARNQLLNAVKNATGMTAQQLNSNVEFRSWLEALTDTTRSIEANRSILENLERFIASGGKYSARTTSGKTAPAATGNWSVVK